MSLTLLSRTVFATCGRKAVVASKPAAYPIASRKLSSTAHYTLPTPAVVPAEDRFEKLAEPVPRQQACRTPRLFRLLCEAALSKVSCVSERCAVIDRAYSTSTAAIVN